MGVEWARVCPERGHLARQQCVISSGDEEEADVHKLLRAALVFSATAALIASATIGAEAKTSGAHFMPDTSASVNDSGALVVAIDEAGVGSQDVTYTLTASAQAVYACINGGSNHPKAANKETVAGQVSAGGAFSPINGRITASLTTGPLSAGGFTCPSGQTLVLASVAYSNILLSDTTNGVSINLGSVSRTFVTL